MTPPDRGGAPVGPFINTILQRLDAEIIRRLQLRAVRLEVRRNLEVPGKPVDTVYFLETGMASMTANFQNGRQVEVSMYGYQSVVGLSGLMGTRRSLNSTFMQLGGHGYACSLAIAKAEFGRCGLFHDLSLRYVQAQLTQMAQSAACNITHNQDQRLARWLLICSDRVQRPTLELSQEFIAEMLGSTRTTVTLAARALRERGLIEYRRGSIRLIDIPGLEAQACECYLVVRDHLRDEAEFDTGFVA